MKILFLSHCVPYPPNKGDKLRAYHLLRQLGQRHEVHLLALEKAEEDAGYAEQLRGICSSVESFPVDHAAGKLRSAAALFGSGSLTLAYFRSAALAQRVRALAGAERYDAVVAYSSAMAPYAEMIDGVPRVLDLVDVDSAKWAQYARFSRRPLRWVYAREADRLKRYERSLGASFERITVCARRERDLLLSFDPPVPAVTVPNGVCSEFFHRLDLPKSDSPNLVFTGQMDYFPNVDGVCHFAEQVFPGIYERFPDAEFVVVGRSPTTRVRKLGMLPGVTVTGAVGDVRPFLSRAWLFVAPLRIAQGLQNKVLEAMACELPVVCTPPVAAGLADGRFRAGTDWLIARSDEDFGRAVADLLADRALRQRMGHDARLRALRAFDWERSAKRFEHYLVQAAGGDLAEPVRLHEPQSEETVSLPVASAVAREAVGGDRLPGAETARPYELAGARRRLILLAEDAVDS